MGGLVRRIGIIVVLALLAAGCGGSADDLELAASGYAKKSRQYRLIKSGFAAYRQRKAPLALKKLEEAVSLGAGHPIVLYRLAVVSRIAGRRKRAAAFFIKAGELFREKKINHKYAAWSWIGAGNLAYRGKDFKNAEKFYLRAYGIAPADPGVLNRLGKVYFRTKKFKLVVSYLAKAVPGNLKNDLLLSGAYLKLERFAPVTSLLKPHHSGGDTPLPVLMNLGLARMGLAKRAESKKDYLKAYRNALKGKSHFEQTVLRLESGDEPFVKSHTGKRLKYFRIRSREYRDFSRREVIRYAKKTGGQS